MASLAVLRIHKAQFAVKANSTVRPFAVWAGCRRLSVSV
jgi:hypothetical protein